MVSSCYSLEVYMQAYEKGVMPCRDKSEWTKTNGPEVLPPYYEKKVGRPKRCRRKDPEENEKGTKLSKHGVKMHCSYCRSGEHTKRNCAAYKTDMENGIAFGSEAAAPDEATTHDAAQDESTTQAAAPDESTTQAAAPDESTTQEAAPDTDAAPEKGRRKRKPSRKKMEQEEAQREYEARKRRATVFDENGDIDDPAILSHIIAKHQVASHDPTQLEASLVYRLSNEVPTRSKIVADPVPQDSSYVAEHRAQVPLSGRTSTALENWRTRIAPEHEKAVASAGPGRGRGRGRARARGGARGSMLTTRRNTGEPPRKGRGRWLLLGDEASTSRAPVEYQNAEMNNTQEPPSDCSD